MSEVLRFRNRRFHPWSYAAIAVGLANLIYVLFGGSGFRTFELDFGMAVDLFLPLYIIFFFGMEAFSKPLRISAEGIHISNMGLDGVNYPWGSVFEIEAKRISSKKIKMRFKVGKFYWREHTFFENEVMQAAPLIKQGVPAFQDEALNA